MNKQSFNNVIKIASVYSGAILGAGFASGKEITEYFISYGQKGIYGLILSGILFGVVGFAVMDITYKYNIKSYKEFTDIVLGKFVGNIMEWVSVIFMFILFSTMLSASSAMAEQSKNFSPKFVVIGLSVVCIITFMFDIKAIIFVNSIVSPILLFGGIFLGLYAFLEKIIPVGIDIVKLKDNWITSAIIYVAYNIITAISVLSSMGELITKRKIALYGGLLGGFTLGIMGICLGLGILVNYNEIAKLQLPVLNIVNKYGITIKNFYLIMLMLAIYTTATINGYTAITWATKRFKINRIIFMFLFVIAGFLVGQLEFAKFINVIYPIFGYIGMFEIIVILIDFLFIKHSLQS